MAALFDALATLAAVELRQKLAAELAACPAVFDPGTILIPALSLMHQPELLLLDEPYAGFDWETYVHFWEMSKRRRDAGMGILIVSHLLAERDRLDRIYSLTDGRTVAE